MIKRHGETLYSNSCMQQAGIPKARHNHANTGSIT